MVVAPPTPVVVAPDCDPPIVVVAAPPPVFTPPTFPPGIVVEEPLVVLPWESEPIFVALLGGSRLQMWWAGDTVDVTEMEFFLADREGRALAHRRLLDPPYTVIFPRPRGLAFLGLTIAYDDGTKFTTLIPERLLREAVERQRRDF